MPLRDDFDDDVEEVDDEDEFDKDEPHYPHIEELSPEHQAVLKAIQTPQDIRECMVMDTWHDDHQLCVGAAINGVEFGAWWVGWELAGAMLFSDSAKAGPMIVEYLQGQFENIATEPQDPNEITPEDLPPRPQ